MPVRPDSTSDTNDSYVMLMDGPRRPPQMRRSMSWKASTSRRSWPPIRARCMSISIQSSIVTNALLSVCVKSDRCWFVIVPSTVPCSPKMWQLARTTL